MNQGEFENEMQKMSTAGVWAVEQVAARSIPGVVMSVLTVEEERDDPRLGHPDVSVVFGGAAATAPLVAELGRQREELVEISIDNVIPTPRRIYKI